MAADDWVIIARLGAPYGLKGWHHVQSFTQPPSNILNFEHWYVQVKGEWQQRKLVQKRPHGKQFVAQLEGIETPEAAALLTQAYIACQRDTLLALPEGQFYWRDLEGLTVYQADKEIGKITYLYENAGTDIMVIQNGKTEVQIPFLWHDTVKTVDFNAGKLEVDWPC